ncbi:segregation/condensation protein A [Bacillus sp. CGMCC 1.16541]|uniref:segregation/condensation protein A n=1 Tax=Bacillus sp. CGMCC 1.16541 TaxID=2185143 RepID=UPI000D7258A4|nr:segregation/condensation protein A [Bacillus sp. CGMCC 1.16541]
MEYSVKVDAFEGPLDLLLHLINRFEIDIYDIPVAQITEQYMMYIHTMTELQLDVASEYLVVAATLLQIKSKMLLPKYEEEMIDEFDEFQEEEDPREELMKQLIEYRKFKEAAQELKQLEENRSHVYTKLPTVLTSVQEQQQDSKQDMDISFYDMLSAFQKLMKRKQLQKPIRATINRQDIPIEKRMDEIILELKAMKGKKNFFQLFPYHERNHVVVTFLAVLELMKGNKIVVEQESNFEDLYVSYQEKSES